MRRQPSCLTCARLLHSILLQRPIRCDYEMDYPRASRSSTRGSQARGTRLVMFLFAEIWNTFFVFRRWYINKFLFGWQLRYFLHKYSLVFVVFLHFFTVFCVFLLPIFKFCCVVQSNLYSAKTAANGFLKFIVLLCPFCFFSVCFFPSFSRCYFLYYIMIYV